MKVLSILIKGEKELVMINPTRKPEVKIFLLHYESSYITDLQSAIINSIEEYLKRIFRQKERYIV